MVAGRIGQFIHRRNRHPKRLKAAAYGYAAGDSQKPADLTILENIDRFGVKAITGRDVLNYGQIARMRYCENVVKAFQARERAPDWVAWVKDNPNVASLLNEAERIYNEQSD
jgi:hypothetical protein